MHSCFFYQECFENYLSLLNDIVFDELPFFILDKEGFFIFGASRLRRALRFAARSSLGPSPPQAARSGPAGHCCTSLGQALRAPKTITLTQIQN